MISNNYLKDTIHDTATEGLVQHTLQAIAGFRFIVNSFSYFRFSISGENSVPKPPQALAWERCASLSSERKPKNN